MGSGQIPQPKWDFNFSTAIFLVLAKPPQPKKTFGCVIFKNLHSQKKLLAVSFSKTSTAKIKVWMYKFYFPYSRPKLSIEREKEG